MVQDVVQKGSNLLLKTRLISLRLYRVRICSCQKGFSFDRFVQRGVVLQSPTRSGSGLVGSSSRSSTCLGSGELLLVCVLALLGPSSASLYSCSDSVVSG